MARDLDRVLARVRSWRAEERQHHVVNHLARRVDDLAIVCRVALGVGQRASTARAEHTLGNGYGIASAHTHNGDGSTSWGGASDDRIGLVNHMVRAWV